MNPSIDDIFEQIRALLLELEELGGDDPRREDLLTQRDRLREEARDRAGTTRHPRSVETEIEMLISRLAEIDALFVTKGYAEKYIKRGFSDPGAYSVAINRKLADDHALEKATIEERLAELARIDPSDRGS